MSNPTFLEYKAALEQIMSLEKFLRGLWTNSLNLFLKKMFYWQNILLSLQFYIIFRFTAKITKLYTI
jgi:hypothetical protein